MKNAVASLTVLLSLATTFPAVAQETHTVHFSKGTTGATIHRTVHGDDFVDYRLSAAKGQVMDVIVSPETVYFNILAPQSSGEALYNGSMEGAEFGAPLPASGTYTIRIYQMGASASEGKAHKFTLEIGID